MHIPSNGTILVLSSGGERKAASGDQGRRASNAAADRTSQQNDDEDVRSHSSESQRQPHEVGARAISFIRTLAATA